MVIWFLLWLLTFGSLDALRKSDITYMKRWGWIIPLFLIPALLAIVYFRPLLAAASQQVTKTPLLVLLAAYLLTFLLYALAKKYLRKPVKLIKENPQVYFITLDYRYLLCKPFDLLFQQTMVIIGVLWLAQRGLSLFTIIMCFIFLFGLLHLLWIHRAGKIFGRYFFLTSLLGAIVFPLLILKVEGGFLYSYLAHFLFYTISSVSFWMFAREE